MGKAVVTSFYRWLLYQGNSSNLTNIDFSVGNTGQRSYSILAATSLTFVHTFSSVEFWFLLLVVELIVQRKVGSTHEIRSLSLAFPLSPSCLCHGTDDDNVKVPDESNQHLHFSEASLQRDFAIMIVMMMILMMTVITTGIVMMMAYDSHQPQIPENMTFKEPYWFSLQFKACFPVFIWWS